MPKTKNLVWNVYRYDFNARKIENYNVFNHSGFDRDVKKIPRDDKAEFADKLEEHIEKRGNEPRVLNICPTVGSKIDIYDQLMLNWDYFVDYVWNTLS